MYTEEDLRATLGALEDEAPSPAVVLAGLDRVRRRRVTRRRTVGMAAAAALVAVVTAGSIVATNALTPPETGNAASNPHLERLRFPFEVTDIPGHQVAYRFVDSDGRSTAWVSTTATMTNVYTLEVFRKDRYDPTADQNGEPVQVNGRRGFYRVDMGCQCSSPTGVPGVVWEYAPDSWALVQYQEPAVAPADVREAVLRIADAVRFDRGAPIPVPFRLGYLPEGLEPGSGPAEVNTVTQGARGARVNLVGDGKVLLIAGDEGFGRAMWPDAPIGQPVVGETFDGRPTVTVTLGDVGVQVSGTGFSVEEMTKVARSATAAPDLYDATTWFDAREALPLH